MMMHRRLLVPYTLTVTALLVLGLHVFVQQPKLIQAQKQVETIERDITKRRDATRLLAYQPLAAKMMQSLVPADKTLSLVEKLTQRHGLENVSYNALPARSIAMPGRTMQMQRLTIAFTAQHQEDPVNLWQDVRRYHPNIAQLQDLRVEKTSKDHYQSMITIELYGAP